MISTCLWGFLQHGFHTLDKAVFNGQLSIVPWYGWLGLVVLLLNRWLRTLALILIGGFVGYLVGGPSDAGWNGFWAGAGICAFVSLVCAIAPRRIIVKSPESKKDA
jgi:hypothetical protein